MEGWNPVFLHRKTKAFHKSLWMEAFCVDNTDELDFVPLYVYHSFASIYSLSIFIYI